MRFAVLQIVLLSVAGLIGTLVPQIPAFALRDPAAFTREMANIHLLYDPLTILGVNVGPGLLAVFEALGFFRIFSAPWFMALLTVLVVSIVVCTLDRTPRLWRTAHRVQVVQPPAFFDLRLSERARYEEAPLRPDDLRLVLRARRFRVREAADGSTAHIVYGDRNQYFRLATLFTHLGLILFLAGGAVTGAFGYETVLFVGEGETAPVQPVGTPHNLLVKNVAFEAPTRANGSFEDFWTDLAVYQDGREIARKTIRVNDPLSVGGFAFHQNSFGPAVELAIRDPGGRLVWDGPVLLPREFLGLPQGFLTIPGSPIGLLVFLQRTPDGIPVVALQGLGPVRTDGESGVMFQARLGLGGTSDPAATGGYQVHWRNAGAFTGMVVKKDPGQTLIWLAFSSLIVGLMLTFYFPRRRVWARWDGGRLELAMIVDRYVDGRREFGQLLDDLAARTGRRALQRAEASGGPGA